ncbi:MAG: response regulator [Acidobacteriota bacterium]|nr:response regulator [Acidobacteriota bacterium]
MTPARAILIVDDDPEILDMTSTLLRSAGYQVFESRNGDEALAELRRGRPALVLLDISMPGMNGWEVLRLVKEDEETTHVPVVMFSVNYEIREKLHALQQGAVDYVTKPFDTEGLLRRIGEIIGAPAADRS